MGQAKMKVGHNEPVILSGIIFDYK